MREVAEWETLIIDYKDFYITKIYIYFVHQDDEKVPAITFKTLEEAKNYIERLRHNLKFNNKLEDLLND